MTEQTSAIRTPATDLESFDQGWLAAMEQTPLVRTVIGLTGLTRLGERPAPLEQLAAVIGRTPKETAALVRKELNARIEDGLIYWDDPYPGDRTRRTVYIGDHEVRMGSGCAPDVFTFAAVLDVPFRVEEVSPATGRLISIDFVPDGVERVDPPEAVTVLLHPDDLNGIVGGHFDEINANVCRYQPFFASASEAEPWLAAHPGARAFTVTEMFERPWYAHYRDTLRPLIDHPASS